MAFYEMTLDFENPPEAGAYDVSKFQAVTFVKTTPGTGLPALMTISGPGIPGGSATVSNSVLGSYTVNPATCGLTEWQPGETYIRTVNYISAADSRWFDGAEWQYVNPVWSVLGPVAFSVEEEAEGPGTPGNVSSPTPTAGASIVAEDTDFSWTIPDFNGDTFLKYYVYLTLPAVSGGGEVLIGTSFSGLDNLATYTSLVSKEDYSWRVDYLYLNAGTITGPTWTFDTEIVELSGTSETVGGGRGKFPVELGGTSVSVSAAGTGAGGGSGVLTGSLDVSLPPTEINVTKTLYAIANNEFWYESSANVMTELAAANGDLLVSDPLSSTAAFNKVFIANKSRLRVADFTNIRLTSEIAIASNTPTHGQVLVQVSTGAKIIVDYIYYDTGTSDHYVYGRQVGDTEFDTTNDVRDSDTNVIISGANLSAVDDNPHWYTWTEYNKGQDTSFIGMPDGAQLSCLYRGRLVLAGNPDDPYQWYMSRQANPFDWAYTQGNAQTAIAGGNGVMGKAGDVIKALIPWHDDYLILGCSKSMHVMRGDPARGGSLDSFDNTTGIYGPKSWCFDSAGNLYFYGTGGLYYAPRDIFVNGAGSIQNISKNALPNL